MFLPPVLHRAVLAVVHLHLQFLESAQDRQDLVAVFGGIGSRDVEVVVRHPVALFEAGHRDNLSSAALNSSSSAGSTSNTSGTVMLICSPAVNRSTNVSATRRRSCATACIACSC